MTTISRFPDEWTYTIPGYKEELLLSCPKKQEGKMKEEDVAKLVYSKIIIAVEDISNDLHEREIDAKIGMPDFVMINGNKYAFNRCSFDSMVEFPPCWK